jgi:hypothetical protein
MRRLQAHARDGASSSRAFDQSIYRLAGSRAHATAHPPLCDDDANPRRPSNSNSNDKRHSLKTMSFALPVEGRVVAASSWRGGGFRLHAADSEPEFVCGSAHTHTHAQPGPCARRHPAGRSSPLRFPLSNGPGESWRLTFGVVDERLVLLLQLPQQPRVDLHGRGYHGAGPAQVATTARGVAVPRL